MKWFFSLLLLTYTLLGSSTLILKINENFKSKSALSDMQYLETNTTDVSTVYTEPFYSFDKQNLGYFGKATIWTKLSITNTSDTPINLIAYNPKAGMDIVDIYCLKNGEIISIDKMGDNQSFENRPLRGRHSAIEFTLLPHENIELISMLKNKGAMFAEMVLSERNFFFQQESYELMLTAILLTVITLIGVYLVILARVLKQKVFYAYMLHLLSMVLFYGSINGAIYFISQGELAWFQEFMNYFGITLGLGCLWYFHIRLFRLHITSPKISKTTLILFIVFMVLTLSNFLQQHYPILKNISLLLPFVSLVSYGYSLMMLVYILYQRLPYAHYYFMAHFIYYTSLLIYLEMFLGKIPETFFTANIGVIGIIFEALIVTYVMKKMIQQSLHEKQHIEELLLAHSQFLSAGKEMATIIHQWKVPLNRISSILTYLELLVFKKSIPFEALEESLKQMRQSVFFMDDTISSFYDFYRKEQKSETFLLCEYVDKLIDMFKPLLESHKIEIHNQCSKELTLHLKAHILGHVLLILIQNSIESLRQLDHTEERFITIKSVSEKENVTLCVIDSGKGIDPLTMKNLFSKRLSSDKGLGFGLNLAYFLVSKELQGTIIAENLKKGVVFKLLLQNPYKF